MKKIEITYNGFHGRRTFRVLGVVEKVDMGEFSKATISIGAAKRINRVVGCRTHRVVFGNFYPIPGACGCGEGLKDITGKEIDELENVSFYVNKYNEYRGRYPQN